MDVVLHHQRGNLFQAGFRIDGERVGGHRLGNLAGRHFLHLGIDALLPSKGSCRIEEHEKGGQSPAVFSGMVRQLTMVIHAGVCYLMAV